MYADPILRCWIVQLRGSRAIADGISGSIRAPNMTPASPRGVFSDPLIAADVIEHDDWVARRHAPSTSMMSSAGTLYKQAGLILPMGGISASACPEMPTAIEGPNSCYCEQPACFYRTVPGRLVCA